MILQHEVVNVKTHIVGEQIFQLLSLTFINNYCKRNRNKKAFFSNLRGVFASKCVNDNDNLSIRNPLFDNCLLSYIVVVNIDDFSKSLDRKKKQYKSIN